MHWHGIHQNNTPWMDGVEHVTQCGILPQTSFRYIFKAIPSGTFWYPFSHRDSANRWNVWGALLFSKETRKPSEENLGTFVMSLKTTQSLYSNGSHKPHSIFFPALDSGNRFFQTTPPVPGDLPFFGDVAPDGAENGNLYFYSGLINGRGKHPDDSRYPYIQSRLSTFSVDPGEGVPFSSHWISRTLHVSILH